MSIAETFISFGVSVALTIVGKKYVPITVTFSFLLCVLIGLGEWVFTGNGWRLFLSSFCLLHPLIILISLIFLFCKHLGFFNEDKTCIRCKSKMNFTVNPIIGGLKYIGQVYQCENCDYFELEEGKELKLDN